MVLYALESLYAGLMVRVAVNGIMLVVDDTLSSKTLSMALNPYVLEGANQVAVALRRPSDASLEALQRRRGAEDFTLRLQFGERGREPGPEGSLVAFAWPTAQSVPLKDDTWQVVFERTFQAPVAFGPWAWQSAPAGPVDGDALQALAQAVMALDAQARAGDVAALVAAHALKFAELSRALGVPAQKFEADLARKADAILGAADRRIEPLDVAELRFEPLANGRLVRGRRADGSAPLRLAGGGQAIGLEPVFTRVAGSWQIAR